MIIPTIFFILNEIYLFFNASWLWLIVLALFSYYFLNSNSEEEHKNFWILIVPTLFFFLNFYLHRVIDFTFLSSQIHFVLLAALFGIFLRIYSKKGRGSYFFQIIPLLTAGIMAFIFFRSNFFEYFFLKEVILFIGTLALFEADRKTFSVFEKEEIKEIIGGEKEKETEGSQPNDFFSKSPAFSLMAAVVLVELAWILDFLPINFLSLAGIWVAGFFIVRELAILLHKRAFGWKIFLTELLLVFILIFIIMITATWHIY